MQKQAFRAMGCEMLAVLDSDRPQAAEQLAQVPICFEAWEQCLSRFRANSELSHLNANAGRTTPVSAVLWAVLQVAIEAAQQSEGLVIPTLLPALEAAGYDRSFETLAGLPARIRTQLPQVNTDWRAIVLDSHTQSVCLPADMRLDLGGIAKGWAAQQAVQQLQAFGPALIDAGGDIAISGPLADDSPWPVGVADPFDSENQICLLILKGGAVATSGRDYRRWKQGSVWQHHILDPRTQRPAQTDVISATVLAPTASEAEVAAKAALILGSWDGLAWIETSSTLAGLLVHEDGQIIQSSRLQQYLWKGSE